MENLQEIVRRLGQRVRYTGRSHAPFVGEIRMLTERLASVQPITLRGKPDGTEEVVKVGPQVVVPLDDLMVFP